MLCNDCTVLYFDGNFKQRLEAQNKLEEEMKKRYGINQKGDFRYKVYFDDNCIYAEHIPDTELAYRLENCDT